MPRTRWRPPSPDSEETGAATVLAAALVAVLVSAAVGGIAVGAAVVARHRAQAAADLGALAAAAALPAGPRAACQRAEAVVAAMRGTIVDCHAEGLDASVSVEVGAAGTFGRRARASARAGPGLRGA